MFREVVHNYPEGFKEKPWCPHTKLVQMGVSLAGMEVTPETFCYQRVENARFSEGAIHYFQGGDFYPEASCSKAVRLLVEQMKTIKTVINLPTDEEILKKFEKSKSLPAKLKVAETYKKTKEAYDKRKGILDRWRTVIFENTVSTTADEKNVHFRQFESAEELPEEEIINKVKHVTNALLKIVGFEQNTIGWHTGEVKNCPQAPRSYHGRI